MTKAEYFAEVRKIIPPTVMPYFDGHFPRFEAQIEMFEKYLADAKIETVLDIGTGTPFASYWFNLVKGSTVLFGMIEQSKDVNEKVLALHVNLNDSPNCGLPPADVVICTECLEHLPSSMTKARDYLASLVKPGGYLLLSFPLNGLNARDYDKEGFGDYSVSHSGHYREFTFETARAFLDPLGKRFLIAEERKTYTVAYEGDILNVLMQRRPD